MTRVRLLVVYCVSNAKKVGKNTNLQKQWTCCPELKPVCVYIYAETDPITSIWYAHPIYLSHFKNVKPSNWIMWPNWALARFVKLRVAHAPGMSGTFSPPPRVSDADIHQGTCVTHVPWCIPGSLTSGFLWSRCRWKHSRHSRRMHNPQFYASGKKPMNTTHTITNNSSRCNQLKINCLTYLRLFQLYISLCIKCTFPREICDEMVTNLNNATLFPIL